MNIKNRIEKLEEDDQLKNYCSCPDTPKIEVHYSGNEEMQRTGQDIVSIPDNCDNCGRKIMKTMINVEFIEPVGEVVRGSQIHFD